jgi:hypothetical protein
MGNSLRVAVSVQFDRRHDEQDHAQSRDINHGNRLHASPRG